MRGLDRDPAICIVGLGNADCTAAEAQLDRELLMLHTDREFVKRRKSSCLPISDRDRRLEQRLED